MTNTAKTCPSGTPSWFTGHWKDWHRGHSCAQDDGKPRSDAAIAEVAQHEANKDSGYLTDAAAWRPAAVCASRRARSAACTTRGTHRCRRT
jgi:hypothetical protein